MSEQDPIAELMMLADDLAAEEARVLIAVAAGDPATEKRKHRDEAKAALEAHARKMTGSKDPVAELTVTNAASSWSAFKDHKLPPGVYKLYTGPQPEQLMTAEDYAELYRLREAVKGPTGYASWQDAATDERIKRVRAEHDLADLKAVQSQPDETFWMYELEKGGGVYQGVTGPHAESVCRKVADSFDEAGAPFAAYTAPQPDMLRNLLQTIGLDPDAPLTNDQVLAHLHTNYTGKTANRAAMQQALDWMLGHGEVVFAGGGHAAIDPMNEAITALRQALSTGN